MSGAGAGPRILFIGGTGRSGTHALARLIGTHPDWADIPIEARFHCNKRGMPDLLEGRITLKTYLAKLRGFWWHRTRVDGRPRGLYNLMREHEFEAALERFERSFPDDPIAACRGLYLDLLAPWAETAGKPGLVEMSSHNVRASQTLLRLFPEARVIHALRDGRDAATSVSGKTWGPGNPVRALGWWADRLRAIEGGVRGEEDGARFSVPPDRFRVVLLDELIGGDREAELAGLLAFLGSAPDTGLEQEFNRSFTPEAAHLGRWRTELPAPIRAAVAMRYPRIVAALEREGNHAAPALRARLEAGSR